MSATTVEHLCCDDDTPSHAQVHLHEVTVQKEFLAKALAGMCGSITITQDPFQNVLGFAEWEADMHQVPEYAWQDCDSVLSSDIWRVREEWTTLWRLNALR